MEDCAFGTAGDQERMEWVPCDGCWWGRVRNVQDAKVGGVVIRTADFLLVPFEKAKLFHGANVEHADSLVSRCACYKIAVR